MLLIQQSRKSISHSDPLARDHLLRPRVLRSPRAVHACAGTATSGACMCGYFIETGSGLKRQHVTPTSSKVWLTYLPVLHPCSCMGSNRVEQRCWAWCWWRCAAAGGCQRLALGRVAKVMLQFQSIGSSAEHAAILCKASLHRHVDGLCPCCRVFSSSILTVRKPVEQPPTFHGVRKY